TVNTCLSACLDCHCGNQERSDSHTGNRVVGASDHTYHTGRYSREEETEYYDQGCSQKIYADSRNDPDNKYHGNDSDQDSSHRDSLLCSQGSFGCTALDVSHGGAEGLYDQRKGFDQVDDTACGDSARADVFYIVCPDGRRAAASIELGDW